MKRAPMQFLHSTYAKSATGEGDGIVANLKNLETGESELAIVRNPNRSVYAAKKALWDTYTDKLEYMPKTNLDEFVVPEWKMMEELKRILGYRANHYAHPQKLLNDRRIFGADIPIEVLMKQFHSENADGQVSENIRVASLDIETSVLGGREVILNTFISHEHEVSTAILAPFLKGATEEDVRRVVTGELKKFAPTLNKKAQKMLEQYPIKLNFKICNTEVEVIEWVFQQMHKSKDDFCIIWNEGFDINYMTDRLEFHGKNPASIMCHPDVPPDIRVCLFKEDRTPATSLGHWSHKWPHFHLSGYTQFIDAMHLYSRLRKVEGIESSYTLGYIAEKIIGATKLELDDGNHHEMQEHNFVQYIAYNIVDTLLLSIMAKVTGDIYSLLLLMEHSTIPFFAKQTKQLTHWFFSYCKEQGCVPGSCAGSQACEWDKWIANTGGGVLSPVLAKNTGVSRIIEVDEQTALHTLVLDIDVSLGV